jgi:FkbM family methyltransferase
MSFISLAKRVVPTGIKDRLKRDLGVPSIDRTLYAMRANGFYPRAVLDIGAYKGDWMKLCKAVWPESSVLMVEASPERSAILQQLTLGRQELSAECALLGAAATEAVRFYEQDSASSALPEGAKLEQPFVNLPMRTLDELVHGTVFEKPELIKLDVQGYELEVLKGGKTALSRAEAVLLEVNLIPVYAGAPLLEGVVDFMAAEGFRAYDIAGMIRRPLDGALWQMDMVFVRYDSPLISSSSYGV